MIIARKNINKYAPKIIEKIINSYKKKDIILGLAGGRTIPYILTDMKINWNRIQIFLADERLVPLNNIESNYLTLKENLFDKINIPEKNIHTYNIKKKLETYEKEIQKYGGHYDIIIVSAGEDGHIAGLFPNHSVLKENEYFISFNDSPKPPPKRMSISRKLLLKSKIGIILFIGENKREALKNFLDKKIDWKTCPAKLVTELPQHYILTDIEI